MKKLFIVFTCLFTLCGCGKIEEKKEYENITKEEVETIVNNELYVLWNKDKIDDITNNERLTLGLKRYAKDNNLDYYDINSVASSDVEASFKNTSIGNLELTNDHVKGSFKVETCEHNMWKYDKDNGLYTSIPEGHGICAVNEVYHKLENLEEKDGKYVATYKYIFTYGCETDDETILYGSYEDAKAGKNKLGKLTNESDTKEIQEKYDSIKDSLMTYTYTFEKSNNKISLVDFKRN